MNKCTEGWPNAPNDVSPDAYEAFLAHVNGCALHQRILAAEEEEIRSQFRLARGLDPHGRILVGSDLKRTLKQHDRNHVLWKQAAKEMTRPFKRIYLSNRGEDIAGSGKFFDFRKYEGYHRLDPEAGLQIWGVMGEGRSIPPVLLGSYQLKGVQHTGEEHLFPLENGYIVGLRVEQVSEQGFNIGFRCVEQELLERERIEALRNDQAGSVDDATSLPSRLIKETLRCGRSFWRGPTARLRRSVWSFIQSEPLSFQNKVESCAIWAMVFFIGLTAMVWLEEGVQLNARTPSEAESKKSTSTNAKPAKRDRRRQRQISGRTSAGPDKAVKRNGGNQTEPSALPAAQGVGIDNLAAPNNTLPARESKPNAIAQDVDMPVAWYFQSKPASRLVRDGVAIHSVSDSALAKKLTVEMRKRDLSVRPFNARLLKRNHVAVFWNIFREDTAVTVEATLTAAGDSKVLSFRSAGNCHEQVCNEAVRTAVSGVFAVMRDLTHSE